MVEEEKVVVAKKPVNRGRRIVGWCMAGIGVAVIVLGIVGYFETERERRILVGRETTFVSGPVDADGYVDFIGAVNEEFGRGVTVENNAAVVLLKATGTKQFWPRDDRAVWLKSFGGEELPEEGAYVIGFEEFMKEREGKTTGDYDKDVARSNRWDETSKLRRTKPWRASEDAVAAAWVKRNEEAMKWGVEASRRERYFVPLGKKPDGAGILLEARLPPLGSLRSLGNALSARAMMRLGEGDVSGWREDVLAQERLGRLMMQGQTAIHWLVGCAVVQQGQACVHGAMGRIGKADAEEMLRGLRGLAEPVDVVESIDKTERLLPLSALSAMAKYGKGLGELGEEGRVGPPERKELGIWPVDFNGLMRETNTACDMTVTAGRKKTYTEMKAAWKLEADHAKAMQMKEKGAWNPMERAARIVVDMWPSMRRAVIIREKLRVNAHLAELGLLMEIWKAEQGAYPERLAELPAERVNGADEDFFSGGKLVYRREGKGYVLYSVGENARDDGGKKWEEGDAEVKREDRADDVAMRVE